MKKKLIATLCLVVSLSMLLCSCGADNSSSGKNNSKTTIPSISVQGENNSEGTLTTASPDPAPSKDEATTTEAKPSTTTEAKPSTTTEAKPSTTTEAKPSTTTEAKPSSTAHVHEWGEWQLTKLANPDEQGNDQRICVTCKAVQNHAFDWQVPTGSYFWNSTSYKNGLPDKVSFQPRLAYWQNDNLYIDYFLVNQTGTVQTVKGINELTISYINTKTGEKTVIAKVTNLTFAKPITIANNDHAQDLYLRIGTNDIVTFNCDLGYLSCAWNFDLV